MGEIAGGWGRGDEGVPEHAGVVTAGLRGREAGLKRLAGVPGSGAKLVMARLSAAGAGPDGEGGATGARGGA